MWRRLLLQNAPYEGAFDLPRLAEYPLTGGQIDLIVKNTAYRVAAKETPLFTVADFVKELEKERVGRGAVSKQKGKPMGFLVCIFRSISSDFDSLG